MKPIKYEVVANAFFIWIPLCVEKLVTYFSASVNTKVEKK